MEELHQSNFKKEPFGKFNIELKLSPIHRYGIFATKDFSPKEIIEECPVIIFKSQGLECCDEISSREFCWDDTNSAIALGYGSMYNHADEPNAAFLADQNNQVMKFTAIKHIPIGAEILVNYGDNWFKSRNHKPLSLDLQKRKNDFRMIKAIILLFVLLILTKIFPINNPATTSIKPQIQPTNTLDKNTITQPIVKFTK